MDKDEWYRNRARIKTVREEAHGTIEALYHLTSAYFAGFDPDPLTGEAVFMTAYQVNEEYPAGVIRVSSIPGPTLEIGLPNDLDEIVIRSHNARPLHRVLNHLQPPIAGDERRFVVVAQRRGAQQVQVEFVKDILAKFAEACFSYVETQRNPSFVSVSTAR